MKKNEKIPALLIVLVMLFSGFLYFQGCKENTPAPPVEETEEEIEEKEEDDPDPEPTSPTYNFKVIVNDKEGGLVNPMSVKDLPEGDSVTVTIKPDSAYVLYGVKVNNLSLLDFEPTTQEFSFVVDNIKRDQKVEIEFIEIDVLMISVRSIEDPAWYLRALKRFKEDGTYLYQGVLPDEMLNARSYFLFPSMKIVSFTANGEIWSDNVKWSLENRILRSDNNNDYYEVLELTPVKYIVKRMPLEYSHSEDYYYYDEYTYEREEYNWEDF